MKLKIFLLSLLLVTASCSKKPEFIRIQNVELSGIRDSLIIATMDYVVYNPNPVRSVLKSSEMEIIYRDTLVGRGYLEKEISLPSKDTIEVPVVAEITLEKLSDFYPILLGSDSLSLTIKGINNIKISMGSSTVRIADKITINTKEIIKDQVRKNIAFKENFRFQDLKLTEIPTLDKTGFSMKIVTRNNLPLDYKLCGLELVFFINDLDHRVGNWKLGKTVFQQAGAITEIPIDVHISNFDLVKYTGLSWLSGGPKLIGSGDAVIEISGFKFDVPIQDTIALDLNYFRPK